MSEHEKINYLEFPTKDIETTKAFYTKTFDWSFEDYGPDYCCVTNAGVGVGFYRAQLNSSTDNGAALVLFYSKTLEQTQQKIESNGGKTIKPTFAFPGGRRFHFADPNGNEFAVWSDIDEQG
jgi:predicted enzyme related to lactoylglutathione lyase